MFRDGYYDFMLPQDQSRQGWECPRCKRINAPFVAECPCSQDAQRGPVITIEPGPREPWTTGTWPPVYGNYTTITNVTKSDGWIVLSASPLTPGPVQVPSAWL